jgi:hypothetical protein
MSESTTKHPPLPPDDLKRALTTARPDTDQTLPHIGLVGHTYTITVSGEDTAGRFCVIDMHIPPGCESFIYYLLKSPLNRDIRQALCAAITG